MAECTKAFMSMGPRNCTGQWFAMYDQKVMFAKIVKKFSVHRNVDEIELNMYRVW